MDHKSFEDLQKEIKQKKEFYINTFLWLFFCLVAAGYGTFFAESYLGLKIVFFGWGAVILTHYFAIFGIPFISKAGQQWEEEQLIKKMEELDNDTLDLNEKLPLKEIQKDYNDSDLV